METYIERITKRLNSKEVKKFKRVIFFVFIALIILDIIFVYIPDSPSISRVIYYSSPKLILLIWLFGLFVSNVFLQRKVKGQLSEKRNFGILLIMTLVFLCTGFYTSRPNGITGDNYSTKIGEVETPYVTNVLCEEQKGDSLHYYNRDCVNLDYNNQVRFRLDFTNQVKFFILLLGILFGYLFWPSKEELSSSMSRPNKK